MSHFVALSRHTGDMKTLLRIDSSARKQGSHSRAHILLSPQRNCWVCAAVFPFSSLPTGDGLRFNLTMPPLRTWGSRTVCAAILTSFQIFYAFLANPQELDPLRLGREVEPVTQAVDLELDPDKDGYTALRESSCNFKSRRTHFVFMRAN